MLVLSGYLEFMRIMLGSSSMKVLLLGEVLGSFPDTNGRLLNKQSIRKCSWRSLADPLNQVDRSLDKKSIRKCSGRFLAYSLIQLIVSK